MSDSGRRTPDVEALTAVLTERAREAAGADPDPEELLDYLEGRLSPEADGAMQRRLVASPAATRRLLDLADLVGAAEASHEVGEDGAGRETPADLAVHAAWRDFQRRLPDADAGAEHATDAPGPVARQRHASRGLAALAAALLVAVLALGAWVWRLEHGGDAYGVANLQTLELIEATRSEEPPSLAVAPGRWFQVLLHPPEVCPSYRAEDVTPGGVRRHLRGLEENELGNLSFLLAAEPGHHTLRLFGCTPERQISSYGFEILPPGDATSGGNAPEP